MDDKPDPVTFAVEKCLKYAAGFDSPASAAIDFINLLKLHGTLSNAEAVEVGRQVIEKLGSRAHEARFQGDHSN